MLSKLNNKKIIVFNNIIFFKKIKNLYNIIFIFYNILN